MVDGKIPRAVLKNKTPETLKGAGLSLKFEQLT
jgi:hypothetical protein